ncbi:hypothetical protein ACFQ60_11015 [Streptomyces zhihengii]
MSSRTSWRARAGTSLLAVLAGVGAFTAPAPPRRTHGPRARRASATTATASRSPPDGGRST